MYYYTYMLRCKDNSIYTGFTNDIEKRMNAHFSKSKQGAKYTKSHEADRLECVWRSKEKVLACKLEYQLKQLTKKEKEEIINGIKLSCYLSGKVDCRKYKRLEKSRM